jgi:3',5'-cyclic AMP phosphodiesterase CpdA
MTGVAYAANDAAPFTFAHLTDMHVQPELGAGDGFKQCIAAVNRLQPRPDFVITGGDLIMDALAVDRERIDVQIKLFDACCRDFELPVHHTIGNHDVGGWADHGKLSRDDAMFGKKLFAERYGQGRTYRSFDHKGWHFVLLDSIGQQPDSLEYLGYVDEPQIEWLKHDLEQTGTQRPIVIVTHIPFYSTWHQVIADPTKPLSPKSLVTNSHAFRKLLKPYNVRLVLSGHGHVRERIEVGHQVHIQSGAVSGLWWKGPVDGDAEAYGLVTCHADRFDYRYETYGWQARNNRVEKLLDRRLFDRIALLA